MAMSPVVDRSTKTCTGCGCSFVSKDGNPQCDVCKCHGGPPVDMQSMMDNQSMMPNKGKKQSMMANDTMGNMDD